MQRVALVVVPLVLLVGCRERNDEFCDNLANQSLDVCAGMMPDGPPVDVSCKGDDGCTATPDQPVCKITDNVGVCVECTPDKRARCPAMMPICTNDKCAPCTRHSDCMESDVCKPDGSCAQATEVAYVNGTSGMDSADCSIGAPCTRIEKAIMTGKPIVKVSGTLTDRTTVNNRNVLILADPGAALALLMDDVALEVRGTSQVQIFDLEISHTGTPRPAKEGVTVADTADLRMTRVTITSNNADGARVSGRARLTCTRCTIEQNTGRGISVQEDGKLTVSQSTIQKNLDGGIAIGTDADEFQIVGNMIFNNGRPTTATPGSTTGGISVPRVSGSSANRIDFNSISHNETILGVAPGVDCESLGTQLTARYNIIWNNGPAPIFGDQINSGINSCGHMFSDLGPSPEPSGTNVKIEPGFIDENGGNLRLMKSQGMLTVTPSVNELTGLAARDIDDQARGATTDMGADHIPRTP